MRAAFLLLALSAAAPSRAQSLLGVGFSATPTPLSLAEFGLKRWLGDQPAVKLKLARLKSQADAYAAERPTDLRDAAAGAPPFSDRLREAGPLDRRDLLESLPGMRPNPLAACRTLESCAEPPVVVEASRAVEVGPAVWALIRPWMLLQQARGRELGVMVGESDADSDRFATLELESSDMTLELNVAALPQGGFQVWLAGGANAAAAFKAARRPLL